MDETITIHYKNDRALSAFVFVSIVLGIIVYYHKPVLQFVVDKNSLKIQLYALIALLLIVALEIFIIYTLIRSEKTLILSHKGFINNAGFKEIGLIAWEDVNSISQTKDLFDDILLIHLKDPNKYKNKITNKIALKLLAKNEQYYSTFLIINPKLYKYNTEKLIATIHKYFQQNTSP